MSSSGNDGKWQARIRAGGKIHYLGRYEREEDAALAYDEAAMMCHGVAAITNFGRPGIHINAVHTRPGYITGTIQHAAITMLLQEALAFQVCSTHSVGSSNGFEKKFTAEKHKIQGHHISAVLEHSEPIIFRNYWINEPLGDQSGHPHSAATAEIVAASSSTNTLQSADKVNTLAWSNDEIKHSIKALRKRLKARKGYVKPGGNPPSRPKTLDWKEQVRAKTLHARLRVEARGAQPTAEL